MRKHTPCSALHRLTFAIKKDTIHQLQNTTTCLEDANTLKKDMCALVVFFASAFNTIDHECMLWIMYDLGFPTDAIDAIKNVDSIL